MVSTLSFIGFDPLYFVFVGPFILLALWAQWKVKHAFARAKEIPARSGMTGAQVARRILDNHGMRTVDIDVGHGMLSDHYDPRTKRVHLSEDVYHGRSLAALGVAAHEVGHAIQDRTNYALLGLRNTIVPTAGIGSQLGPFLVMIGLLMAYAIRSSPIGWWIAVGGVALFALAVVFQVINLPVEFDASRRAKQILVTDGFIAADEQPAVAKVLSAAAMTYVAATLTAIATLLYLLVRVSGARRE